MNWAPTNQAINCKYGFSLHYWYPHAKKSSAHHLNVYHLPILPLPFSSVIVESCSIAACKSSMILAISTSGEGKSLASSKLLSPQPEDVKAQFVTLDQFIIAKAMEPFAFLP